MEKCPKCGRSFERLLAVSRSDNETRICDECGTREALGTLGTVKTLEFMKKAFENPAGNATGMGRVAGKGTDCPVSINTYKELYLHHAEAIRTAMEALEEVQQYRAVGTVRELRELKESSLSGLELAEAAVALRMLKQYQDIGTVEECRNAVEKRIPKKPVKEPDRYCGLIQHYHCPSCGRYFGQSGVHDVILFEKERYCQAQGCGQAIDWEDEG